MTDRLLLHQKLRKTWIKLAAILYSYIWHHVKNCL